MKRIVFRPKAGQDIDDIWNEGARRWGVDQAQKYNIELEIAVRFFAEHPSATRRCDEIQPGLTAWNSGAHVIYARVEGDRLVIIRVLHSRMDAKRRLEP